MKSNDRAEVCFEHPEKLAYFSDLADRWETILASFAE